MIATAVPAVTSLKNSAIYATVPSHPQASMAGSWAEGQKLHASDATANKMFGTCVALDGDTALIGAVLGNGNAPSSGSAYVFTHTGTTWTQQQKLIASDGAANDQFGCYVSLYGDTALIGACWDDDNGVDSGSAYVFTRTGTTWTQQQKLTASDGAAGDEFGYCVSLAGDTALIGAQAYNTGNGSAYVFTRTGTTWTLQQKLLASDGQAGDCFGFMVSLDGNTALIGADYDDDNGIDSGSAYVFTCNGTTWTQQAKLLASDGAAGDQFSAGEVALDGDTAFIGAWDNDDNGANSGSAYVFTRTGTTWTQQVKLLASDGAAGDQFGIGIALDGDTAFITAWSDDDLGTNSGSVYVFTKGGIDIGIDITGGLGVNAVITNHEITNVTDVTWQIHIEGGILGRINKTVNGTIGIPAGGTKTVGTGMLLGFGAISITVKVADYERTVKGTQLIIFSMVKK